MRQCETDAHLYDMELWSIKNGGGLANGHRTSIIQQPVEGTKFGRIPLALHNLHGEILHCE